MHTLKHASPSDSGNQAAQKHTLVLDANFCVTAASSSFYDVFQVTPGEMVGKKLAGIGVGQWDIPALLALLNGLPEKTASLMTLRWNTISKC